MSKKTLLMGQHPLRDQLLEQCRQLGRTATVIDTLDLPGTVPDYDELVVLAAANLDDPLMSDARALALLSEMAAALPDGHARPTVHLLLQRPVSLWLVQTRDLPRSVTDRMDVYPFTAEQQWADSLFATGGTAPLDRRPIGPQAAQTVHLVIAGLGDMGQTLAERAALVAHFPNYRPHDEQPLRTRITIVDDSMQARQSNFMARHQPLFDNSHWRDVDPTAATCQTHQPALTGRRDDFTDVEWEFVHAPLTHPTVRERLQRWAADPARQLTIAVTTGDDGHNLTAALSLPDSVLASDTPVLVEQRARESIAAHIGTDHATSRLTLFGGPRCPYDLTLPLVRMGKLVNYFYTMRHTAAEPPTSLPLDRVESLWQEQRSMPMRLANIHNAMTVDTKMRSLGHNPDDGQFYALTSDEARSLMQTEHYRWCTERLITGWRPCTDKEKERAREDKAEKKRLKQQRAHTDLCSYEELTSDETGQDVRDYDLAVVAGTLIIVNTFKQLPHD